MTDNINQMILPPIINGLERPSFAFMSINERWPKIVTKIIDQLHQFHHEAVRLYGEQGDADVKLVISKLSEMRYRMMTDKPLTEIDEKTIDSIVWNEELRRLQNINPSENLSWYNGPWLFVECLMYRKIYQYFQQTKNLQNYDPFCVDKERSFIDSTKEMIAIGTELINLNEKLLDPKETRESIFRFMQITLWGNKCDLSLSGGDPHMMSSTIFHELEELSSNILANDFDQAIDSFIMKLKPSPSGQRRIDVVLDNAGLETFVDLCLADFLISKQLVDKVILHGKEIPWFVSDTTATDLNWIIESLVENEDHYLKIVGKRWKEYLENGTFEFRAHPFWTYGFPYCRMLEISPDLYKDLSGTSFIIFKGDLNYRKLVGDRKWPHTIPFRNALCGFEPAAFITLRTLKAETIAGLSEQVIKTVLGKFKPDDLCWMTSSDYAVAQLFAGD